VLDALEFIGGKDKKGNLVSDRRKKKERRGDCDEEKSDEHQKLLSNLIEKEKVVSLCFLGAVCPKDKET